MCIKFVSMLKYFYKLVWKRYKLESDAVWSEHWEYKINEKLGIKVNRVIWSICFFKVSIEGLDIHDVSKSCSMYMLCLISFGISAKTTW